MQRRSKQDDAKPSPPDEKKERTPKDGKAARRRKTVQPRRYKDPVDDTLDGSFPASDPPSWAGR